MDYDLLKIKFLKLFKNSYNDRYRYVQSFWITLDHTRDNLQQFFKIIYRTTIIITFFLNYGV